MDGHYIGLMSGTSMDAIDAVLVGFRGDSIELVAHHTHPLPKTLRGSLLDAAHDAATPISRMTELDVQTGRLFAGAALALLRHSSISAQKIRAIGSHGQTIYHRPSSDAPTTLQIGDPNIIAERTGIVTVADFRRRDIAADGQGAPLVPAFHRAVFHSASEDRVVLNIGGIANITILPRDAGEPVRGFDTGPGNALMDDWIRRHQGVSFDRDGAWAASGRVQTGLLNALLNDSYFAQPPPKSTGREHFNPSWFTDVLQSCQSSFAAADVQATLCELTAAAIVLAIEEHAPTVTRVLVCGGGARNAHLMTRLHARLTPRIVEPTDLHGIPSQWVEAMAFAWLARQRLMGSPGNLPAVTGARHSVVLGAVYAGRSAE